jgi:hypothetical protein
MEKQESSRPADAVTPDAGIEAEVERIRLLSIGELRDLYRRTFSSAPPKALTKDLTARMVTWRIQEQAYGGFDRATLKLLNDYAGAKDTAVEGVRRLRAGTVVIRDCQNERHTVTVMMDGLLWRGRTYQSLSAVARAITGMTWNGPRFFGLRLGGGNVAANKASPASAKPRTTLMARDPGSFLERRDPVGEPAA